MSIIFNPQETSRLSVQRLKYRQEHKEEAIPFGHSEIDAVMNPLLPGDLVTVLGRPGNGKTGIMLHWARERARFLMEKKLEKRYVVYLTYEQTVEDLNAIQIAADKQLNITKLARGEITETEWDAIMKGAVSRATMPLWYMGHSQENRKERPKITTKSIIENLQRLERDRDCQIDMVFVDYLQRIPFGGRPESKTVGTIEVLDELKNHALALACPFVVGVQARRSVDDKQLQIPGMDDGQWSSNIEQASDKIISVTRPRQYRKEGEEFGSIIVQSYTQMLISLLKQKLGPDNIAVWCFFDPATNKLGELEKVELQW